MKLARRLSAAILVLEGAFLAWGLIIFITFGLVLGGIGPGDPDMEPSPHTTPDYVYLLGIYAPIAGFPVFFLAALALLKEVRDMTRTERLLALLVLAFVAAVNIFWGITIAVSGGDDESHPTADKVGSWFTGTVLILIGAACLAHIANRRSAVT